MMKTVKHYLLVALSATILLGMMSPQWTSAQDPAADSPGAAAEAPPDLDFNMDTAEFEDFGEEDFVVEEKLDPKTDAAITAVKVIAALALVIAIVWLIRRMYRGSASRSDQQA